MRLRLVCMWAVVLMVEKLWGESSGLLLIWAVWTELRAVGMECDGMGCLTDTVDQRYIRQVGRQVGK